MISISRRGFAFGLTPLLVLAMGFPVVWADDSGVQGNSRITGKITGQDGKTGVPGALVIAYHLSSEELFHSPATNAKGEYQFSDLPAGYYDLAVRTPEGLFVGTSVISVAPAREAIANLSVMPFDALPSGDSSAQRGFPGSEGTTAGSAEVEKKLTTREFWRSAKGVAILGSGGTALLLAIVSGGDEQTVSPF